VIIGTDDWFSHRGLLESIGNVRPAELDVAGYGQRNKLGLVA
jgi:hypothetical protein